MRKQQEIEQRILLAIAGHGDEPSNHILDAAKAELRKKRAKRIQGLVRWVAVAMAIVLFVAVSLPMILVYADPIVNTERIDYSSMQDYFDGNGIRLRAIDYPFDISWNTIGFNNETNSKSAFQKENCAIVQKKGTPLYISEKYRRNDGSRLTCNVLLTGNPRVKKHYFAEYLNLENTYIKYNYIFHYSFDDVQHVGWASAEYNGYPVYFYIECETSRQFFRLLEITLVMLY